MSRQLVLASAVALALLPSVASALGLGGIRTQSALNEPFYAEIDLVGAKPEELDGIKVVLAPPEEFERAGAPRAYFLTRLRFQPQVSPQGRPVILVTSPDPVREPFLDFLVEVNWAQGRMVKGYTVLLDPPVTRDRRAPRVERPAATSVSTPSGAMGTQRLAAGPAAVPAGVGGEYPMRYGPVESGAGLWRIARNLAPPGATVAQTAMALYRSNQGAFIRGDINRLRVGQVLELPSAAELFALSPADAEREFRAALRGGRVTSSPLVQVAQAAPTEDRLRIATPAETTSAPAAVPQGPPPPAVPTGPGPELGALQQELLLVQEAGESTRQETEELRARIRELEAQLGDIQRLLQLRNEQLAMVQATQLAEAPAPAAEQTDIVPPDLAPPPAETPEEPGVAAEAPAAAAPEPEPSGEVAREAGPVAEVAPEPEPVAEAPPPSAPEVVAAIEPEEPSPASTAAPPAKEGAGQPPARIAAPAARPAPAPEPPSSPLAGWTDTLLASPLALGGTAAVLAAMLALVLVLRRRRLSVAPVGGLGAGLPDSGLSMRDSALPETAPAKPAWADSRLATGDSVLAAPEGETEEGDVISEADVYIAYGRYREAQTLLEDELKRSPGRMELKFKLAEAYAGSKNLAALKYLMSDMERSGAYRLHHDQWQRLERMHRDLEASVSPMPEATVARERGVPPAPERAAPVTGLQPEAPIALGAAQSTTKAEARGSDLALDLDDLDLIATPTPAPVTRAESSTITTDLDLQRQELDRFSEIDFGDSEPLIEEPSARQVAAAPTPEPSALAASDSFDLLLPLSKEPESAEIATSQWQADSGLWDEVTTKIDLARAYIEMEDPEAARVILQEVVGEGNEGQRAEARELLARLG